MASDENPLTKLVLLENLIFYFDLSTEELELMIEGLDELKLKIVKRRLDGDELCLVDYKNRLSGDSVERLARTVDHLDLPSGRSVIRSESESFVQISPSICSGRSSRICKFIDYIVLIDNEVMMDAIGKTTDMRFSLKRPHRSRGDQVSSKKQSCSNF